MYMPTFAPTVLATFYIGSTDTYNAWQDATTVPYLFARRVRGMWQGEQERVLEAVVPVNHWEPWEHAERIAADISAVSGNSCTLVVMRAADRLTEVPHGWTRVSQAWHEDVDRSQSYTVNERGEVFQWQADPAGYWAASLVFPNGATVPLS